MKSAYELAMERLNRTAPVARVTDAQRGQLAELDSVYKAKTAERELALEADLARATASGDLETVEKLNQQWNHERQRLAAELEEKKEHVRQSR
jgi:hypothetical protein